MKEALHWGVVVAGVTAHQNAPRCLITTTTTFARFRALRTRRDDPRLQPVSDRGLAIFIAALAAALVLGYLFVNKLADMSSEEDCAVAHRKNCGAVELSR